VKKLGLLLTAIAAMSLGSLPASAGDDGPYLAAPSLVLSPSTASPGASVAASFIGCSVGEVVNFTYNPTVSATCGTDGVANTTLTAPAAAGAYPVVAVGATSGATATATFTVVVAAPPGGGGELPATGSDNAPTAQIATGLVAAGAGLAIVGGLRRRKHASA